MATRKPAIRPPPAIANRLKPASRKPIAAPGRMACAMASPIRLMRRSIRNTPIGGAPSDSANTADQRAAHEFEIGERRDQRVVEHRFRLPARHPPRPRRRRRSRRTPRTCGALAEVFRGQARRRCAPGHRLARQQQGFREIRACTRSMSCSAASTVRFSPCQRRTSVNRSAEVLASMAVNGSSSTISARVLQQQPRKQHALHLAAGQRADGALLEAGEADGGDARLRSLRDPCGRRRRKRLSRRHSPIADHVVDVDRKRAVDIGDLRQIGDVAGVEAVALDRAGERLE